MNETHVAPPLDFQIYKTHLHWEGRCWNIPPAMPQSSVPGAGGNGAAIRSATMLRALAGVFGI